LTQFHQHFSVQQQASLESILTRPFSSINADRKLILSAKYFSDEHAFKLQREPQKI
jgi:hypothetical protein